MDRVFGLLYKLDFDMIEINSYSLISADMKGIYAKYRIFNCGVKL